MTTHRKRLKRERQKIRGRAKASARKAAAASVAELARQDVRGFLAPARAGSASLLAAGIKAAALAK